MTVLESPQAAPEKRIDDLRGGELLRLLLHREGKEPSDIVTRFVGFAVEGDYDRARFQEDGLAFVWNVRHANDRWLYGVNQFEYATIAEVLEGPRGNYEFDKHLTKLAARKRPEPDAPDFQPNNPQFKKRSRHHASGVSAKQERWEQRVKNS